MKYSGKIKGVCFNVNEGIRGFLTKQSFEVHYTSDEFGKTLSICDLETGEMISIPFDELYKIITK